MKPRTSPVSRILTLAKYTIRNYVFKIQEFIFVLKSHSRPVEVVRMTVREMLDLGEMSGIAA